MNGKGGPAQARRRARRAAERENSTSTDVLVADATEDVETASTEADTFDGVGSCAECGHPADMHADIQDGDNMGSCSASGCDCGGFASKSANTIDGTEGTFKLDVSNLVMTFTTVDGTNVSVPVNGGTEGNVFTIAPRSGLGFAFDEPAFSGATNPDIPAEHQSGETLPNGEQAGEDVAAGPSGMRWTATIAPEGVPTDDGRIFAPDAVTWRELPLSLGVMMDTPHADVVTASPVCGRIDRIYRQGNLIMAEGVFDDSPLGSEVARMVSDGTLRGVSVDLAIAKMEIAYRSDILDENDQWKGGDAPADDGPDMLDILFGDSEDEVMFVIWDGIIGAVTICPFPAFADARIEVAKSLVAAVQSSMLWTVTMQHGMTVVASDKPDTVTASAVAELDTDRDTIPVRPSRDCFEDPQFEELTAPTVDGNRYYGHAAAWGVCHIGIPGVCTTAPNSPSGYAYFHLKEVECEDGEVVSCGTVTLDTGHADRRLGRVETAAHYDNTGTAVADIVCGEDDFGIWFSGALRSTVDESTVRKLRGAVLSGDWRAANTSGELELIALLAVNVPGFPVPRHERAMIASADDGLHVTSLVAAGIVTDDTITLAERAQFEALADLADGSFADFVARAQEAAE